VTAAYRDPRLGEWQVAELTAGRVHYAERGTGTPVLFVHGGLCNANIWRGVVPLLAEGHRCIVPDLPQGSHREPMRPDADVTPPGQVRLLIELLDRLGLDEVLVVSNDAGGAISQMLAGSHPERVRALVLSSCDTYRQFPPRYLKPLHLVARVPGLGAWVGPRLAKAWTWRWMQRIFFGSITFRPIEPAVLASYVEPLRLSGIRHDLARFFAGIRSRHTLTAARQLATFPQPVLVVWGERDLWFARRNARRLVAALPDARLEILSECRTLVPEDQPGRFGELVADFFASRVAV
jgi:pimeloyl-ACP methyl ester carboxylesterase